MKSEVISGMVSRNMTKTKQVLVINKIFVDIVAGNCWSLAMNW